VIIGAGLSEKGSKELFLVAAIASLLFWFIEANWKTFQLSYYSRIKCIESYFADPDNVSINPLQIYKFWGSSNKKCNKRRVFYVMWWPTVMLPHVILFAGGILLYQLISYGVTCVIPPD